jgi:hypothetical protein
VALDFVQVAANYLDYGLGGLSSLVDGKSKIAISAWIFADTLTASQFGNRIIFGNIDTTNLGFSINIDGNAGASKLRCAARSVSTDAQQTRTGLLDIGTGVWAHVGMLIDLDADTITPIVNGVADNAGGAAFGSPVYDYGTPSLADRIGTSNVTPVVTADQFDGRIAEVAIWGLSSSDAAFTTADWGMLADGFSPLMVRPHHLVFYETLNQRTTSLQDRISKAIGTINGALSYAVHPRMTYWRKSRVYPASSVFRNVTLTTTSPHGTAIQIQSNLALAPRAVHPAFLVRVGHLVLRPIRSGIATLVTQVPALTAIAASVSAAVTASMTLLKLVSSRGFSGNAGLGIHLPPRRRWTRRR